MRESNAFSNHEIPNIAFCQFITFCEPGTDTHHGHQIISDIGIWDILCSITSLNKGSVTMTSLL